VAGCVAAPSAETVFTIYKLVSGVSTSVGTITYAGGDTSGTVSISSDHSISVGNSLYVTSPAGGLNSIDTPFWTLVGLIPS